MSFFRIVNVVVFAIGFVAASGLFYLAAEPFRRIRKEEYLIVSIAAGALTLSMCLLAAASLAWSLHWLTENPYTQLLAIVAAGGLAFILRIAERPLPSSAKK